jgi:hypothetical protein
VFQTFRQIKFESNLKEKVDRVNTPLQKFEANLKDKVDCINTPLQHTLNTREKII